MTSGQLFSATFTVYGIPKAQPRPRAFARKFGNKYSARVYDAGTAEGWKSLVAVAGRQHCPAQPLTVPIALAIKFYLPRPKRLCRRSDPTGEMPCPTKPDIENLAKAVMDCMTQAGWWVDDSQVVELFAGKRWHAIGERPCARISVKECAR